MIEIDSLNNQEFFLLIFLFFSCFWLFLLINQARDTKKIIQNLHDSFEKRKVTTEKYLENFGNTKEIFEYFEENQTKLSETLHNIMLANSLNKDFWAERYIKSIDVQSGTIKINHKKKRLKC